MRILTRGFALVALLLTLVVGTAITTSAAHNGNNRAELTGTGDWDASGAAIVNYAEGRGTFNGTITVKNLEPGETYTFFVRTAAGGEVEICSGSADADSTFACSAQNLTLPGFGRAVVRDAAGEEVAVGVFERRGNCRDPNQAGSQCEANNS